MTFKAQRAWLKTRQKSAAHVLESIKQGVIYGDVPERLAQEDFAATTAILKVFEAWEASGQLALFAHND